MRGRRQSRVRYLEHAVVQLHRGATMTETAGLCLGHVIPSRERNANIRPYCLQTVCKVMEDWGAYVGKGRVLPKDDMSGTA